MSRRRAVGRLGLLALAFALAGSAGLACLYNDTGTFVESNDRNPSPVRIVEGIPLEDEAQQACGGTCPLPLQTALPYFLNPEDPAYQFCICSEDRIDEGQLPGVFLYAEDQDANLDGSPTDSLYAAALLDWDPTLGDSAFDYVAYRAYLDPQRELELASVTSYELEAPKRPRPYVRAIELSIGSKFDLCNGAGRSVGPGFHTLSIMVTDRSWADRSGEGDTGAGSETTDLPDSAVSLEGVPDIAAGATYDIQTYVFFCYEDGEDQCGCEDIPDP